jgi:hypothetical protein
MNMVEYIRYMVMAGGLKHGLKQCTEPQRLMFKRMYAGGNLDMPIDEVVDNMPVEKLQHALNQVLSTHRLNAERGEE